VGIQNFTQYKPSDADYLKYNGTGYSFNGAGHLVGTHRMGFTKDDSVVNREQRTWDHENLYLVGCGNMPTIGTSNPTLTMSALAFWAAENILKQLLKSGN
jgi:choline dehydrogenase-like flavoprotein